MSKVITIQDGDLTLDPITGNIVVPTATTKILLPQENDAVNPTIAFGDGDTGIFELTDDALYFTTGGVSRARIDGDGVRSAASGGGLLKNVVPSATNPTLAPNNNDLDTGVGLAALDQLSLIAGGVEGIRITEAAGIITVDIAGAIATSDIILLTDIATATPPTTEAVSGEYQIRDADNNDVLLRFGYAGSNRFELINRMHGGQVQFTAENNAGTETILFNADPDGIAILYEQGGLRLLTAPTGVEVRGALGNDPTTGGNQDALFALENTASARAGSFGFTAGPALFVENHVHGGNMELRTQNVAGTIHSLITLDPDTEQVILPLSNDAVSPTLAFGDGDTGFFESADDTIRLAIAGVTKFTFGSARLTGQNGATLSNSLATATIPSLMPTSNDLDTGLGTAGLDQLSLIAGGVEILRLVETGTATTDQLIIGPAGLIGGATAPSLAFGDGDTGFYEGADDSLRVALGGLLKFLFVGNSFQTSSADGAALIVQSPTATVPTFNPNKADSDTGIGWAAADQLSLIAGGVEAIRYSEATGVIVTAQSDTGLTADVGSAQGNGVILSTYNVYSTVGTAGDAATLPATFGVGTKIYVKNDGANSMDVFPASGDNAGAGLNTAVAVAAGTSATFIATATDATWTQLIEIAAGGSGTVTSSGTPLNNEIAVFTSGTDIDSDAGLTWDGTSLTASQIIVDSLTINGTSVASSGSLSLLTNATENAVVATTNLGVALYYDNVKRFTSDISGSVQIFRDGDTDTENNRLWFSHQTAETKRGMVGYNTTANLRVSNLIHSGHTILESEDAAGFTREFLRGDPDATTTLHGDTGVTISVIGGAPENALVATQNGSVDLYYDNIKRFATGSVGVSSIYSNTSTDAQIRVLNFEHQDGTVRAQVGHTAAGSTFYIRNQINGAPLTITAQDAGGAVRPGFSFDPDADTDITGDIDVNIFVQAGAETAAIFAANGAVTLYWDNLSKFRTADHTAADQISGAEVLDAEGNFKPIGIGVVIDDATNWGNGTLTPFQQVNATQVIIHDDATATVMNTYANTGATQTDIPAGAMWYVRNDGAGALTIGNGTSVVLSWLDGGGATPPTGTRTLARGGLATLRKVSDTAYDIWGIGLT